jgi:hypothetical protein
VPAGGTGAYFESGNLLPDELPREGIPAYFKGSQVFARMPVEEPAKLQG